MNGEMSLGGKKMNKSNNIDFKIFLFQENLETAKFFKFLIWMGLIILKLQEKNEIADYKIFNFLV